MNWYVPKNISRKYIAGFTFRELCDQNICPRYTQVFDPNLLSSDKFLFMNLDMFEPFVDFLKKNNIQNKFKLVTHNSDREFTKEMIDLVDPFVEKVYALNATVTHPKVIKIPIGFNDQSTEIIDKFQFEETEKTKLVYVNFKLHHHPDRPICLSYFESKDWATKEKTLIPQEDFYNVIKDFKYCICPRGTGIDTHRIYESLLFGVIPIVKNNELSDLYRKLPIILVDSWQEVDYDYLVSNYESNLNKYRSWIEENRNWYLPEYWLR